MTLDRRRFLQLTAGGVVASFTSAACARESALSQPGLLEFLGAERVRRIGARYRAAVPNENSHAALRAAISQRQSFWPGWIERQVRDDFAAGRTVLVDGWVLSATEARQCALFSLVSA
jgi:hypothetical protein